MSTIKESELPVAPKSGSGKTKICIGRDELASEVFLIMLKKYLGEHTDTEIADSAIQYTDKFLSRLQK